MFVQHHFGSSNGRILSGQPTPITIPTAPDAALTLAGRLDRLADEMLSEGRHRQAERLSHLALEARCRATGTRA